MHAQTNQGANAKAVSAERQRIARDLHDGVGSRLIALLARLDPHDAGQQDLADSLRECLLDLQTTVDALEEGPELSIAAGLARLRYRVQPAFDRMGILVVWNVQETGKDGGLNADAATEICKIAQEAMTNVVRHSCASRMDVTLESRGDGHPVVLEIGDDGCGMPPSAIAATDRSEGRRGQHNMRFRAQRLGAQLDIFNRLPHGLCVRLVQPRGA